VLGSARAAQESLVVENPTEYTSSKWSFGSFEMGGI
jgi:hypothetical protein